MRIHSGHIIQPLICAAIFVFMCSCNGRDGNVFQGYVDADFVYIGSALGGRLDQLSVKRGQWIKEGEKIFQLEPDPEESRMQEAEQRLEASRARLEDLRKGSRPTELESLQARLDQAKADLRLSERERDRLMALHGKDFVSRDDLDKSETAVQSNKKRKEQLEADLKTAELGGREDLIRAAEAEVKSFEAALEQAKWAFDQKQMTSPVSALVMDTLFEPGEYVPAGRPVIWLLPPSHLKVRFYIPEKSFSNVKQGGKVEIDADGLNAGIPGYISFISSEAEYTPPVIFSEERREQLVFLAEARFETGTEIPLRPGQPVEVVID